VLTLRQNYIVTHYQLDYGGVHQSPLGLA
jgi:hypothetical protein